MRARSRSAYTQSRRFQEKRKARSVRVVILFIVAIATWSFSLVRFTDLEALAINEVDVVGAGADIQSDLSSAAWSALNGDYLKLFSRSNILIYPKGQVASAVASASARLSAVDVRSKGAHAIEVVVKEKNPSAVICASLPEFKGNSINLEDPESCYMADQTGFVFKRAEYGGQAYERYYAPFVGEAASSTAGAIGMYATSTAKFSMLHEFYSGAKQAGIDAVAILIKEGGEYEMYASNPQHKSSEESPVDTIVIYFSDLRPFSEQLADLSSFWTAMAEKFKSEGRNVSYDYIDVRYGPNVFYREMK